MTVWHYIAKKKKSVPIFGVLEPKNGLIALILGPILKFLLSVIFFAFLTPPRAYMDGNTILYAWVGTVWLKTRQTAKFGKNAKIIKSGIDEKMVLLFSIFWA